MDHNAFITAEERNKSEMKQLEFQYNKLCGMMLTNKGEIYDINQQMNHCELDGDFNMMVGFNLYDILFSDKLNIKTMPIDSIGSDM